MRNGGVSTPASLNISDYNSRVASNDDNFMQNYSAASVYKNQTKPIQVAASANTAEAGKVNENGDSFYSRFAQDPKRLEIKMQNELPAEIDKIVNARLTFTEQKIAQSELQEKYPDYMFFTSPMGLIVTTPEGKTVLASSLG